MTQEQTTIDPQEVDKFAQHASRWWEVQGPLKTLHDINPARMDFIKSHTPLSGLTVLDVGCGGGILSEAMAKEGGKIVGIDATQEAVDAAVAHALQSQLEIDYLCVPVEHHESAGYDVITCMELLEHVTEPALVVSHCQRLLKPGGMLFLSTINRTIKAYAGAIFVAEYLLALLPRQTHDFEKFITPSELTSMARKMGLELVDLKGLAYNPITREASLTADVSINYLAAFRKI